MPELYRFKPILQTKAILEIGNTTGSGSLELVVSETVHLNSISLYSGYIETLYIDFYIV